jgi:integrase/recombinase XerD
VPGVDGGGAHRAPWVGHEDLGSSEELVPRNPVANVKRLKVGTDTVSTGLDKNELAALIRVAESDSPRSLALVLLLGLNGLRISEALGCDVTDIDTNHT